MATYYWRSLLVLAALQQCAPVTGFAPTGTRRLTPLTGFNHLHTAFSKQHGSQRPWALSVSAPVKVEEASQLEASLNSSSSPSLLPSEDNNRNSDEPPDYEELTKSIMNGAILAVSFGYAAYTILNIDHGMTRGWSQSEIAMRIPIDNWSNYETSLAENPIETKTLINVVIYLLGDWLSQTVFQKKNVLDFDPWRTVRNGFIGLCFGPLVAEYYNFSDHILPVDGGMLVRLQKILMDQTLYLTVKCSLYISAVGLLQGDDVGTVKNNVKERLPDIVKTAWKFWPLVHCVTYGVIPAQHRILWVNSVDLVWNAILATLARKDEAEEVKHELQVLGEEVEHELHVLGDGLQALESHAEDDVHHAVDEVHHAVDEVHHAMDEVGMLMEVLEEPLVVLGRNATFEFHSSPSSSSPEKDEDGQQDSTMSLAP